MTLGTVGLVSRAIGLRKRLMPLCVKMPNSGLADNRSIPINFFDALSSHDLLRLPGFEEVGCVSSARYQEAVRVRDGLQEALAALEALALSTPNWRRKLPDIGISEAKGAIQT